MTVLTPSIFYFHHQTVLRLAYLNCVKHFSFPRFLFTILLLSLHLFGVFIISFGRLMDELFFRGYKDVDLSDPVFIISNPRCGTTFLHRLLCLDKDRYTFTLLYHTLLPSVFYIKMIQKIASYTVQCSGNVTFRNGAGFANYNGKPSVIAVGHGLSPETQFQVFPINGGVN